jgi:PAS domain S-box-containing protein
MTSQQNITILIIEDKLGDQLLLKENLKSANLLITTIITAESLSEGISLLKQLDISLIFLDLFLPDSMGLDSFSELIKINSRVPIVIYSKLSDSEIALKAINAGAQDILTKGDFTVSLLEKTVLYSIERKSNLDALEESNEKFNLISKATHDMVWDWDLVTGEVFRNTEGWKKIFRTDKKKIIGTREHWRAKIHPDDLEKSNKVFDDIINSNSQELFEMDLKIVRDDGTIGHIEDRGYVIRNDNGKAIRIIGATHDITEKKLAEEKVLLQKQRYKSLVQNGTDLLGVLDAEGNFINVSPSSKKILGIAPALFMGKNVFSFIHEDDIPKFKSGFAEVLNSTLVDIPLFRFKNAAGEWRWIESTITNLLNDPAVKGIVFNSRDVTEKKIADEKLQFSEQRFKSLVQNATDLLAVIDAEGNFIYASPSSKKILGIEASFFIGKNAFTFIHEDDQQIAFAALQVVISGNFEEITQYRFKNGTGEWRWIESTGINLLNDSAVGGIVINARDVTDKKNSDDKLLLSEKRFKSLAQNSSDLLAIINIEGEYKYVSPSIQKILGYDPEFMVGKSIFMFVHEDDQEKIQRFLVENAHKEISEIPPFRNKTIWNDWKWFEGTMTNLIDDPSVGGIVINTWDTTDKKMADEKLLFSEQRFKSLVQNSTDLLMILDSNAIQTYVSPSVKKILGYDPEDLEGKNGFEFIHEDDHQKMQEFFAENVHKQFFEAPLFRFKNKSGEWRWIEGNLTNLIDDPAVGGIVFNSRDVTAKKLADDELINLSLIVKETVNGILILNNEYKVTWANNAFTEMTGYELKEIVGISPLKFFSGPETDSVTKSFIKEKLDLNEPFVFDKLNYTKTGNKIFMKAQLQPTFNENGTLKQYISIITDITKQKELEQQVELEKLMKQKEITEAVFTAQEIERSHIGRELHDNVNQLLGATHLYIDMARKNEEARDALLDSASSYTYNAITEIRKLSKTLITPSIKDVGLIDSIKYVTEEIMLVHPIKIIFTARGFIEEGLSQKFKLNIFRIVQEQINNILKHAKAKNISINVEESVDRILFSITDDGIGFDIEKIKPGIGITNIKSRCELNNCVMELTSALGSGTTLLMTYNKIDSSNNNPIL